MTDQLTLKQSLQELFPTLPAPIQRFIKEGKPGEVAQSIMDRYVLHVDQGAIIEHQILLALFGVVGPDEFMETLSNKLPISDDVVGDIIEDLNREVFVPLREEMRKGSATMQQPQKPAAPQAPRWGSQTSPNLPARPTAHMAGNEPLRNVLASVTREGGQTSLKSGEKLLEDHEEPHIDISDKAPSSKPYPLPLTSRPVPRPFVAPSAWGQRTAPRPSVAPGVGGPPMNLPGAIQPPNPVAPKVESSSILKPAVVQPPPPAPAKPYSSDPYREPIE